MINSISELSGASTGVAIYFTSPDCSVCAGLKPKIREMIKSDFPGLNYHEIDVSGYPALAAEAMVYSAPTIIVWFEGKEYIRESRLISVPQLEERIRKYYEMLFE